MNKNMNVQELFQILEGGESSKVQFKERLPHPDSLVKELIAFSNSQGGIIFFGVYDNQLVIVTIEEGISKPYKDSKGTIGFNCFLRKAEP